MPSPVHCSTNLMFLRVILAFSLISAFGCGGQSSGPSQASGGSNGTSTAQDKANSSDSAGALADGGGTGASTPATGNAGGSSDAGTTTGGNFAADASGTPPPVGSDASNPSPADAIAAVDAGADAAAADDVGADSVDSAGSCNTTDPTILYLSADDSNSMAGATIARGLIDQGQFVYKAVRTYEFLNYYDFPYPAAPVDHVAASAQMAEASPGIYHLQIGVRAPDFSTADRRRLNVAIAIDTSSSMGWGKPGSTGRDIAQSACLSLVAALDKGDTFSLLGWGTSTQVVIDSQTLSAPDDGSLAKACVQLANQGTTGLSAGLSKAYEQVKKNYDSKKINRVILISDGGANLGQTDADIIAQSAKDGDNQTIYLMGAGVGDPWNYNDTLMNAVTDAGKGAYVFMDSQQEAQQIFGANLLRHVEIAARNVQVQVTLPPTFQMKKFYGEQYSTDPKAVEPQHLAANDAMVFNQVIESCDPKALTGKEEIKVVANWTHPQTLQPMQDVWTAKLSDLLAGDQALLTKGDAIVAYAEALKDLQVLESDVALARVDKALAVVQGAQVKLPADVDLQQVAALLTAYRKVFEKGEANLWQTGGTGADPIALQNQDCTGVGNDLTNLACALDIADPKVLIKQSFTSPTSSPTAGVYAATAHFGDAGNGLAPQIGKNYAIMATGPALGTSHSVDVGGQSMVDPVMPGGAAAYNAMEWKLQLQAPAGANGIRLRHVFFSEEYDEYVGSQFNDKFYILIEAGSTNGGKATVINYTDCRKPDQYYDFVCSPGMEFCNPRQRYCYIAINTALSECCWLGGCPSGTAKTSIAGTGFECASSQSADGQVHGSSTGWLMTEWPIEPGELFTLTFHVHDTGDGVFDSAALLDGLQFVGSVTPGTWPIAPVY